ncbi:TPA: DUF2157 domain-containing protein [Methanosarcina acetivorans]|uniref:DUF2157 domain-containing protein n=2 Tax=Methanosarcina acetivorans TaxID=2214 RepID=Q8TP66_METAC|nr:DUF2157 domain-containing protein [Methanosarcina acetivorans]AAM05454.1 predicted protein [Methanosarcina acetivorans C2A]HIH94054.1 DUF2157 domain-containing protein [Methanosarcina acetivorans]
MFDEDFILKWLDEGTIDHAQAEKMKEDLAEYKRERRSKKQIVAFSTIGAILIGIGAILFVASNWEKIGNTVKVLLLVGTTVGVHYAGYRLKYEQQKYPRLGSALVLLSALLFGASLFLIAQIYNINANNSTLVLIWILGVFPLIYGYRSASIAGLCSLLFYLWVSLLYRESPDLDKLISIWDLYLISGISIYFLGVLNGLTEKVKHAETPFKFMGLQAALFALFAHTFKLGEYQPDKIVPVIYAILGILFLAVLLPKPLRERLIGFQADASMSIVALLMAGITLTTIYIPASEETYMVLFNVIFLGLLTLLLYAGYSTENIGIINTAMFWFVLLIFARYFDFFWELLPRSLFFMLGGLVLLVISVVLERKRRELKVQFSGGEQ